MSTKPRCGTPLVGSVFGSLACAAESAFAGGAVRTLAGPGSGACGPDWLLMVPAPRSRDGVRSCRGAGVPALRPQRHPSPALPCRAHAQPGHVAHAYCLTGVWDLTASSASRIPWVVAAAPRSLV